MASTHALLRKMSFLILLIFGLNSFSGIEDEPRYKNRPLLGKGSFGAVYDFEDYVVKVSRFSLTSDKVQSSLQNLKEAALLTAFDHPNIVKPEKINFYTGLYGSYLEIYLPKLYKIDKSEVGYALNDIVLALDYVHSLGISHRDIKPAHIRTNGQRYFLIDWGGADLFAVDPTPYCGTTRWYRCPHSLLCDQSFPLALDMWSLAVSLVEVLGQEPLFPGDNTGDTLSLMRKKPKSEFDEAAFNNKLLNTVVDTDSLENLVKKNIANTQVSEKQLLFKAMLKPDPQERISSSESLISLGLKQVVGEPLREIDHSRIFDQQQQIDGHMRRVFLHWLITVCNNANIGDKVFFETVQILDRFIETTKIEKGNFQLVGLIALFLAAAFHDQDISVKHAIKLSNFIYSIREFECAFFYLINNAGFDIILNSVLRNYQNIIYKKRSYEERKLFMEILKLIESSDLYMALPISTKWAMAESLTDSNHIIAHKAFLSIARELLMTFKYDAELFFKDMKIARPIFGRVQKMLASYDEAKSIHINK